MKLDISDLHKHGIGWDDPIPNSMTNVWAANFDLIQEIGNIEFHRAVIQPDALNLDIETLEIAEASEKLICAAVYARFEHLGGGYSCQLIFARNKIVHDITIPRTELEAAVLDVSTGHIVHASLKERHKKCWKITDSQVVLHWVNSTKAALKPWVRNRVAEITRLSERSNWYFAKSKDMVVDLGMRKGVTIDQLQPGSPWIDGLPWMRKSAENFPLQSVTDLKLSSKEDREVNKERIIPEVVDYTQCLLVKYVPKEIAKQYELSNYLINPNRYRFRKVIGILASVLLHIHKISAKCKNLWNFDFRQFDDQSDGPSSSETRNSFIVFPVYKASGANMVDVAVVQLSGHFLEAARNYYYRKAMTEIRVFIDKSKYENILVMRNNILYYTGRILPTQKIDGKVSPSDASLDLTEATFCVPLTDSLSPVAYAIVSETHWHDPDVKHKGVESTLRYAQTNAYIIDGRSLVKSIIKGCIKCRILHKKGVEVAMGPIGEEKLKMAPPFYFNQIDLCGPFSAYSPANKPASLKVWLLIFCSTVTCAVDCRVMENYMTDAFVSAFVRFACRFGYQKLLMPDEGIQHIWGCENMVLSFSDIHHKITTEYGIEFKPCPVGAHYVNGKVEWKIQQIKKLSLITLGTRSLIGERFLSIGNSRKMFFLCYFL